jgi:hypothetical protein
MEYPEIMQKTIETFHDRASQYGDMRETLERQAKMATLVLDKTITAYDIAMIMHCIKMGRIPSDRNNVDSYVDGINYFAFAGMLATTKSIEQEIADLAKKFAPASVDGSEA